MRTIFCVIAISLLGGGFSNAQTLKDAFDVCKKHARLSQTGRPIEYDPDWSVGCRNIEKQYWESTFAAKKAEEDKRDREMIDRLVKK